jgi:PAS domain S-box-containing protein
MFGFEETEIGESLEDWARLLHPDEKDWMLKFLEDFLAGTSPTVTVEYRLRHKDGSYRWIVATGLVLRDEQGKAYRFVGSHGDITDRKRAEEALQRSEERHRTLMDNIHSGITVMDRELNIVMLNKASAAFIGRPTGKCIGKECFRVFRKQDAVCPDCPGVRAMNTGLPAEIENIGTRDDGSVYVARVRAYPIFAADGHVEGFVELVDDITDRKRAEEALAKEHRNLRYMLRSSDYERQLIAYEIHDGLAQQLAAAIMQFQAYGHLKDTQPKQAAKAYDAGLTMLQQGHFEARRLIAGVRPPILDESGVVEAVAHLVHEQGRDQGPKIEYHSRVDFDRLDPTFENAIYRIAQEALTNACMHSKSERISVSLLQREDRLRIEIRDWGVGFDPKTGPKNRFGLEGIRQRARLLGGKCNIRSKAGKGTRITVELPVIPRDEEV